MEEAGIVRRGINTCAGERGISCELEEPLPWQYSCITTCTTEARTDRASRGREGLPKNALLIIPLLGGIKKVPMLVTKSKVISSLMGISK